jgi:Nickel responsive protein SCO4226-like
MRQEGLDVSYLRSTFLPEEERCFCLFEGQNADLVIEANRRALLPFERVHRAAHIASDDLT